MWSAHDRTTTLLRKLDNYPQVGEPVGLFTGAAEKAVAREDQEQRIIICNSAPQHRTSGRACSVT